MPKEPRWLSIMRIIVSLANLVPEIVVPILHTKEDKPSTGGRDSADAGPLKVTNIPLDDFNRGQ